MSAIGDILKKVGETGELPEIRTSVTIERETLINFYLGTIITVTIILLIAQILKIVSKQ